MKIAHHLPKLGFLSALFIAFSCNNESSKFDASGMFEAEETIISAEGQGVLKALRIEEGQQLSAQEVVGYVDTLSLYLKKKQLQAQITALLGKKPNITVQLSSLQEQLRSAQTEKARIERLLKGDAATTKQLDDINTQIEVIRRQMEAQKSTLNITSEGMNKDAVALQYQLQQIEDQISKSIIRNPINGTVLSQFSRVNEMVSVGKPLYKIADVSELLLRVYVSGKQLPSVKLNQQVTVLTDDGNDAYHKASGRIVWISDKAEFTPKTIQTKDERVNRVYAVKVKVKNDGRYKIGMYGEILLHSEGENK